MLSFFTEENVDRVYTVMRDAVADVCATTATHTAQNGHAHHDIDDTFHFAEQLVSNVVLKVCATSCVCMAGCMRVHAWH